ncbi:MAG TPA: hypothetical protein VMF91_07955 [Bryobacteraceae bacterium]|nr:hypothetical protein [Bryobacteraceae bacterium]
MMTEDEIQQALELALVQSDWHKKIAGQEKLATVAAMQSHKFFLPSFPIDYLVRKRLVSAAAHVLTRLNTATVASTSKSNVSLTAPSATFYPDLVLVDEERAQVIIVELKKSKQTERQALTELLAYEHEIRNYVPFLSNLELSFVLVSTEFSPLLEHSIAALTTWESKQILCLKAETTSGLTLSIHLPEPWAAIGQHALPDNAIPTLTLRLDSSDNEADSDLLLKLLEPAIQLIAREGDRVRSHGFAMLWLDSWAGRVTASRFCITLGFLNPYVFFPDAIKSGVLATPKTAFGEFLLDDTRRTGLEHAFGSFSAIAEKAVLLLREYSRPNWELPMDWKSLRQFSSPLRHRAIPLSFEFWGSLGEYARELVVHPAARQGFMPELRRRALTWSDRAVAVPLLDQIGGVSLFDAGEFWCSDIYYLGARLGALASACSTLQQDPQLLGTNIEALFEWAKLDVVAALREIRYRYVAARELSVPPPTLTLRPADQAGDIIPEIEALANWVNGEFLGPENEVHRRFFSLGLATFQLLDEAFQSESNVALVRSGQQEAISASREFLRSLAADIDNEQLAPGIAAKLKGLLVTAFSIEHAGRPLASSVSEAPDDLFLNSFPTAMLAAADELFPSALHELALPASMEVVDWEWLKQQVEKLRLQGVKYPAVQLNPDGAFVTTIVDETKGSLLRPIDEETEVFFINNFSGFSIGIITTWSELTTGEVLKDVNQR